MTDVEILGDLIKPIAKVDLNKNYEKFNVTLTEPQARKSYQVDIYNVPYDTIVIKVDIFSSPDAVFNGNKGECKRADYAIISEEKKVIVYIEMKATKDLETQIIQQLAGAQCFIAYCREIGKSFWGDASFLLDYQYRFVSIGHIGIPKQPTRDKKLGVKNDKPENMLKIDWPHHILFNKLVGSK